MPLFTVLDDGETNCVSVKSVNEFFTKIAGYPVSSAGYSAKSVSSASLPTYYYHYELGIGHGKCMTQL